MHDVSRPPFPGTDTGTSGENQPMAVVVEIHSSSALLTMLTTLARLGCRTVHIFATERRAALGLLAPPRTRHRVVPCLRELIEVLDVVETPGAVASPSSESLGAVA